MKKVNIITNKIIRRLFKNVRPFAIDLYERMDGKHFVIGLRFNKYREVGFIGYKNVIGIMYGYKYKTYQWITIEE